MKRKLQRRSIRLKGYDYSQAGLYFITICVQDRKCLFGDVVDGEMVLNDAGTMVTKWYYELMNKFNDIQCDEMVVMPNHFHCIIQNVGTVGAVGADLRVCPDMRDGHPDMRTDTDGKMETPHNETGISDGRDAVLGERGTIVLGEHIGSPLHRVLQWFKTMTTNEYIRGVKNYGWPPFDRRIWQRNYYEHIIRNEQSYNRIAQYIVDNPLKWQEDRFFAP